MSTKDVSVGIGADNSELSRVLTESKGMVREFFETITEEGKGIGDTLEGIQSKFRSAFEFTGIAAGIEAIHKIGETLEEIGSKALEIRTVSSVLGITTDQMQAMQEAAEEAGVGNDQLTHAGERLVAMLTEARNGSASAVEKLLTLGLTTQQIQNPMFGLNDLLQIMHDRLENAGTRQETMNELIVLLGSRAALAAAAIREYDGTTEGVAKTIERINGLTEEQVERVGKAKTAWTEYFTSIWNGITKVWFGSQAMDMSGMNALTVGNAGTVGQAQADVKNQNPFADLAEESGKAADEMIAEMGRAAKATETEWTATQNQMRLQELENIKAGVEAFKQGSAQKIAALQREYEAAQLVYGDNTNEKVRAIYQQLIAEQRAFAEAQVRASQEAMAAEDKHVAGVLRGYAEMIDTDGRYLQKQLDDARKAQQVMREQIQLEDQAAAARLRAINTQLTESERFLAQQQRNAQIFQQHWGNAFRTMSGAFGSAMTNMLRGSMGFGEAMRNMFASIAEAAVQNAATNIAQMGMQALVGKGLRSEEIRQDAGAAAAGAYKAIVGIPYVGPFLAPAAAAVAYAGVLAFDSAAGGYDIPAGVNPVTQLHEREMVLPASLADPMRDMLSNRNPPTIHLHAKSGKDTVTVDEVVAMIKRAGMHFKLS